MRQYPVKRKTDPNTQNLRVCLDSRMGVTKNWRFPMERSPLRLFPRPARQNTLPLQVPSTLIAEQATSNASPYKFESDARLPMPITARTTLASTTARNGPLQITRVAFLSAGQGNSCS